ncbi:hypothetical protein [Rhodococcus sp. DMU1]|nr:hypothetical protein [Rhodococcus sp. DMU1]QIX53990.1 hypothetical protein HFP48_31145 [Rhodococcus sp. DMU1]
MQALLDAHRLLYEVAASSTSGSKRIPDFDVDAFECDVEQVAAELGWT